MERLQDIYYKVEALSNTKRIYEPEREKYIRKQVERSYPGVDSKIVEELIKSAKIKSKTEDPLVDVTDLSRVKTLDEFINEAIEKDRETVVEIGESLKELINSAQEQDVIELEESETTQEEPVGAFDGESYEEDGFEEILKTAEKKNQPEIPEKSDEQEFIKPKYFVIKIGDEGNSKQIVIDGEGNHVGEIQDGKFKINEEYIDSRLEKFNIDDYISVKVPNLEEQQRIRKQLQPKTLEQLSQMDFNSGEEILKKVQETIDEPETQLEPEEKGVKERTDDTGLEVDEEDDKRKETMEQLDKIAEERDGEKMEDFLDKNSSRKLTILIPYTLTDQLPNHQLKERGEPITVYQLKGTIKPIFVLKQGDRVLYGDRYNEQIGKNMERVPYSSGVVREVSDEKTSAKVTLIDGTEKEFLIKGEPRDISEDDKNIVRAKLIELSAELNRIKNITPDDMIDYRIEFGNDGDKPEIKCQRIDYIEMEIYKICKEYGIEPPAEIRENAQKQTKTNQLSENDGAKSLDDMIPGASSSKFGNLY